MICLCCLVGVFDVWVCVWMFCLQMFALFVVFSWFWFLLVLLFLLGFCWLLASLVVLTGGFGCLILWFVFVLSQWVAGWLVLLAFCGCGCDDGGCFCDLDLELLFTCLGLLVLCCRFGLF